MSTAVLLVSLLLASPVVCGPLSSAYGQDPEVHYGPIELITSKGYPAETHTVTTEDGYVLEIHRIPGPRSTVEQSIADRPVFFLQHGLLCSSTNWLTNLVNESLGYLLADAGFDVWMGNIRGNTYGRVHKTLKPDQREFWNFTFDEHASKDLPAMVNYVLTTTRQTELFYVGHSQGTVMGFAQFTANQALAKQIKAFFALAPVTTLKHVKGLIYVASNPLIYPELTYLLDRLGTGEFLTNSDIIKFFGKDLCLPEFQLIDGLCEDVLFIICGFDTDNINITRLPVYYTHTPAGTSVKNLIHYAQEVNSGRFAMYDYGSTEKNMIAYGTPTPPSYNISELSIPTALFTGSKDWLADPTDVNNNLPIINSTGSVFYWKNVEKYDHLDFIWGLDAADIIYKDIIKLAKDML